MALYQVVILGLSTGIIAIELWRKNNKKLSISFLIFSTILYSIFLDIFKRLP